MLHLANLSLVILLFTNLLGLALISGLWLRNAWLSLTAGPWLFCSLGFFLEGFHGLGSLGWLCTITTVASVVLILEVTGKCGYLSPFDKRLKLEEWRKELSPRLNPLPYVTFSILFCYTMLWRYTFPDLDGSSEKLADLSFICSYFSGETIPVHDVWFHPFLSTHYYSFQHYAAALLGRILGTDPGVAYNVAFCTLISLAGTAGIGSVCLATRKPWIRALISAAWIVGGSGATLLVHFVSSNPDLWSSMRFIGSANMDKAPLGTFLADYTNYYTPKELPHPMDLPGEPLSYSIYLGDYHPPLSGFYLLALALLALSIWTASASSRVLVIAGATLPWCLVADTWNVPLEALGLAAWVIYNRTDLYRAGAWRYLLAGILGGTAAIYPYFKWFALAATDYPTVIKWVPWGSPFPPLLWLLFRPGTFFQQALGSHTPPLLWLLFLLPTFGLTVAALFSRSKSVIALGRLWLGFLIFSECFFVKDIYCGEFLRFNTTLKWWPWIAAGTLLTLGPRLLELKSRRWVWTLSLILICYPIFYIWDLGDNWIHNTHKENVGRLDGAAYLTVNHDHLLLDYLQAVRKGVTVEHPELDFTNGSAMTLLGGQKTYLGWLGHEQLWRGYPFEAQYRYDRLQEFYQGNMANAGTWMLAQGVDYILWFKSQDQDQLWDKVDSTLHPEYAWHEFYYDRGHRVGLWERKN